MTPEERARFRDEWLRKCGFPEERPTEKPATPAP
jgi:hypothetical protein